MIDYLSSNMWQLWAVVAVACLVAELSTGGFYILCFAVGAAVAAVGALFVGVAWQLLLFAVFAIVSLFTVRPFALRYLHTDRDARPSNADAVTGRTGVVSQRIERGGYGRVAIDGDDWKAEATDGTAIEAGRRVMVVGRESVILKVQVAD